MWQKIKNFLRWTFRGRPPYVYYQSFGYYVEAYVLEESADSLKICYEVQPFPASRQMTFTKWVKKDDPCIRYTPLDESDQGEVKHDNVISLARGNGTNREIH